MKLLITGASSTLGKNLTSELLKIDELSIRLLEHHSPLQNENCEVFKCDIQDVGNLAHACSEIDTVIHLAALTHSPTGKEYFEVNETGTDNLLTACRKNSVRRFIFISSAAASEEGGEYGVSKLRCEEMVRESHLNWVILRPSEVYGPNMQEGIGKLITWIKKFPIIPVIGDGSYFLSPVYVDDIVQAIVEVFKKGSLEKEILNLSGPEKFTMSGLIDRLAQIHKVQRKKIFLPVWFVRACIGFLSIFKSNFAFSDQIPRLLCDKEHCIDGAQALIPYKPRKIEEGLLSFEVEKA
ncbi:MAG: NAD(P)-dependent oxidoreductase [Nitrospina sp.]|jgi:NADH dehydrogenase|nr:NAD(P)-dependent oxidoreductase [Nitrospina sp.]MBT6717894.1 NAD(P)-dependent oxidoreductase [Nitrospina sp.]